MGNVGTTKNDYEYWRNKPSSYVVCTTGKSIKASDGILTGIFVGSGAVTTLKLWDSATTGTGTVLVDTFTATTIGMTLFPNVKFSNGLYLTPGVTGPSVTVFYK